MSRRLLLAPLAALALAGCGAEADESLEGFTGAEREVAEKIEDLQEAGERRDAERICSEILGRELVTELDQGDTSCGQEIEDAIEDADEFDLTVRDVTVTGEQAEATVQRGDDEGDTRSFTLAREGGGWRVTSFGPS